jgi:hypothetical protein
MQQGCYGTEPQHHPFCLSHVKSILKNWNLELIVNSTEKESEKQ